MGDGSLQAIGSLSAGMTVVAWDEDSKAYSVQEIEQVHTVPDRPVIRVAVTDGDGNHADDIFTTPDHPFYVENRGWTQVRDIRPGDRLLSARDDDVSGALRVKAITQEGYSATTYNLTVASAHTFFVGPANVWVHNISKDCFQTRAELIDNGGTKLDDNRVIARDGRVYTRQNGEQFIKTNQTINSLDKTPSDLANPADIREEIVQNYFQEKFKRKDDGTALPSSLATASVEVNGQKMYFIAANGNAWSGTSPNSVVIDGKTYHVIRKDSESIPTQTNDNGQSNYNHAEKKLFSHINDNFQGVNAKVNVAVQNTSKEIPGMCKGCSLGSRELSETNPDMKVNIF